MVKHTLNGRLISSNLYNCVPLPRITLLSSSGVKHASSGLISLFFSSNSAITFNFFFSLISIILFLTSFFRSSFKYKSLHVLSLELNCFKLTLALSHFSISFFFSYSISLIDTGYPHPGQQLALLLISFLHEPSYA